MYKKQTFKSNHLKGVEEFEGTCIEKEMEIITNSKQPINRATIGQVFYTRRKDGVLPETDIRTDKWQLGQDAMTYANNDFKNRIKENLKNKEQEKAE